MNARWRWIPGLALAGACGPNARVALPSPFPETQGGATVPASGGALTLGLGDALRGQELQRTEITTYSLTAAAFDRVSLSLGGYNGHADGDPSASETRAKVRLGSLFGPKSSTSVQVSFVSVERRADTLQYERLHTEDVAVSSEAALSDLGGEGRLSLLFGPRVTVEQYTDLLNDANSMHAVYYGVFGGVHLGVGPFDVFGEATLARVPSFTYQGVTHGGDFAVFPMVTATLHVGPSHHWLPR